MNKFHAKKTIFNGIKFDSIKEANYYRILLLQEKATLLKNRVVRIELQVVFKFVLNGYKITTYRLDFIVVYGDGHIECVDVKGCKKGSAYEIFRLKKQMMKAFYNIEIIEK